MSFLDKTLHEVYKNWVKNKTFVTLLWDIYTDISIYKIFNQWWITFNNWKKHEDLRSRLISLASNDWDIILDYHLWSWTTWAVAHKMWRQYIGIEQMDYIEDLAINRLKNVINWIDKWWITKQFNWKWWWDFVYMEIMQENEKFIDDLKDAKNIKDLLEIYNQIKNSEFINYKVDTWNLKFDNLEEKDFEDFKLFLIEILDKNLLYKNYSERNDKNSWVREDDKRVNESFYGS